MVTWTRLNGTLIRVLPLFFHLFLSFVEANPKFIFLDRENNLIMPASGSTTGFFFSPRVSNVKQTCLVENCGWLWDPCDNRSCRVINIRASWMSTDETKRFTVRSVESGLCCWIKNPRPMWYLRQVICIICMQSLRFRTFLPSNELHTAVQLLRPAVLGTSILGSHSTHTSTRLGTGIMGACLTQKPTKCPKFDVTHLVVLFTLMNSTCTPSNTVCISNTTSCINSS
jgi:hypothetical protein